jgi:hypothetical protein
MKHLTRTLSAALAAAALSLPLAAHAATTTSAAGAPASTARTLVLSSRLVQDWHAGEIDGRMRLTITPDGIISGYYRSDDGGWISSVQGGVDAANNVWLEVDALDERSPFTGTLIGTTIDATAYHGADPLHLIATPAR